MRDSTRGSGAASGDADDAMSGVRFGVPPAPSAHVRRPQLTAALAVSANLPLVVVSAPAGTGKTTVVSDWVRRGRRGSTVCWISFEDGDVSFWDPVLESLRRQGVGVPASWSVADGARLGSQRLNALVGLVVGAPARITVVIDGYELTALGIARDVDYLLRHSLGRLCMVFVGRVDPILPLYRYRLNDALLELRAPDLSFSDAEAQQLLRASGTELADSTAHDLNHRLGGWAAGLRFAARALADKVDVEAYAANVVEQTTNINEYLIGEVLNAQPPDVRQVLLDTCVTDVFSVELAELAGGPAAVHAATDLVNRRAFVEPVPGHPDLFSYYPFFRNLLLAELSYESPRRLVELRRIAAAWYRRQGRPGRSLQQLALVGDWQELAVQIIDDGLLGRLLLEEDGGPLTAAALLIPADVDHPAARAVRAATALSHGESGKERCARELAAARRALENGDDPPLVASIAVLDALRGCFTDDPTEAELLVARAEQMLAGAPASAAVRRSVELESLVAFARGMVALRRGDLVEAPAMLARAANLAPDLSSAAFRSSCLGHLAVADALRGELAATVQHAEEALAVASRAGLRQVDIPPSAHVALAWVGVERCDASLTEEHATAARSSRMLPGDPFCLYLVEAALAMLEQAAGQVRTATDRLTAATVAAARRNPWLADQLRVETARLRVRDGEPAEALEVLASAQATDSPEIWVATAAARAEQGLERPLNGVTARDALAPLGTQIRALLVEASDVASQHPGQEGAVLTRALRLASTERIRRPFQDCGASVRQLLAIDPRLSQDNEWLHQLGERASGAPLADGPADLSIVVEPLTAKEREVLGHLQALLTTDEIAQMMFVSVNTVRTHIRHILRKLGVNRRNAAIRRARELGMLDD